MLLKKYDENKEAFKQIGREAIAERRRLGLQISAKDLENEAKDRIEHADEVRVSAAMRQYQLAAILHHSRRPKRFRQIVGLREAAVRRRVDQCR